MSRSIANAVGALASKRSESEIRQDLLSKQWHETKHKIDGILLSSVTMKNDAVRSKCQQLESLKSEERANFIVEHFGPQFAKKVEHLLYQLDTIEKAYIK